MNNYDPTADPALQSLASGGLSPQVQQQLASAYMPPVASAAPPPTANMTPNTGAAPPPAPTTVALNPGLQFSVAPSPSAPGPLGQRGALNVAPSSLPVTPSAQTPLPTPQQHAQLQHLADAQAGHSYTSSGGAAKPGATSMQPPMAMTPGSPGGLTPTSESIERGIQDPELAKAQARAQAADKEYQDAAANVQNVQAVKAQRAVLQDSINAAKDKLVAGHVETETNAARGQMDTARQEAADAQAKGVDPNHWAASRSTGTKIAMILGMMAGGFAAGLKGGPNQAADMIEHEKDQDLQAQRENIDLKGQKAKSATEAYQLVKDKGLDETQKAHAANVLASDALMKQIDAKMSENGTTPEGQVQLAQIKQAIAAKQQESLLQFDEHTKDKIHETLSYKPAVAAGQSPKELEAIKAEGEYLAKGFSPADAKRLGRMAAKLPDSTPGAAVTVPVKGGGSVGRLAKPKVQLETALSELDEIQKLSSKPLLTPAEHAKLVTLTESAKANGIEGLPEPAGKINLAEQVTGSRNAQVTTAASEARRKLENIDALSKSGALASGGEADASEAP